MQVELAIIDRVGSRVDVNKSLQELGVDFQHNGTYKMDSEDYNLCIISGKLKKVTNNIIDADYIRWCEQYNIIPCMLEDR